MSTTSEACLGVRKSKGAAVVVLGHPMGCRTYVVADEKTRDAFVIDPHLDFCGEVSELCNREGWRLRYVADTHTHADHPSGAAALAARHGATRIAHPAAGHRGATVLPPDRERLVLGETSIEARHAPGHTADNMVFLTAGALFSGDSLFIESVARADFLGGDAGELFDSIQALLGDLPDTTVLYPGHA